MEHRLASELMDEALRQCQLTNPSFLTWEDKINYLRQAWIDVYNNMIDSGLDYNIKEINLLPLGSHQNLPLDFYQIKEVVDSFGNQYSPQQMETDFKWSVYKYRIVDDIIEKSWLSNMTGVPVKLRYYQKPKTVTLTQPQIEMTEQNGCDFGIQTENQVTYDEREHTFVYDGLVFCTDRPTGNLNAWDPINLRMVTQTYPTDYIINHSLDMGKTELWPVSDIPTSLETRYPTIFTCLNGENNKWYGPDIDEDIPDLFGWSQKNYRWDEDQQIYKGLPGQRRTKTNDGTNEITQLGALTRLNGVLPNYVGYSYEGKDSAIPPSTDYDWNLALNQWEQFWPSEKDYIDRSNDISYMPIFPWWYERMDNEIPEGIKKDIWEENGPITSNLDFRNSKLVKIVVSDPYQWLTYQDKNTGHHYVLLFHGGSFQYIDDYDPFARKGRQSDGMVISAFHDDQTGYGVLYKKFNGGADPQYYYCGQFPDTKFNVPSFVVFDIIQTLMAEKIARDDNNLAQVESITYRLDLLYKQFWKSVQYDKSQTFRVVDTIGAKRWWRRGNWRGRMMYN